MSNLLDQQFEYWTVVGHSTDSKFVECLCACGTKRAVRKASLVSGQSKSCGCQRYKKLQSLVGKQFNQLTVVEQVSSDKEGRWWRCKCTCGGETIVSTGILRTGHQKACGCLQSRRGESHHFWQGGRYLNSQGYVILTDHTHPNSDPQHRLFEHHKVMSEIIGRPVRTKEGESVHHKNGIKDDNRPENLELWTSFQPSGQRVIDLIDYCEKFLMKYAPEKLQGDKYESDDEETDCGDPL